MNRELSQIVKIFFPSAILYSGQSISSVETIANASLSFDEKPKSSAAGVLYEQSLKIIVDKQDSEVLDLLIPMSEVRVALSDGDKEYIWGDSDVPVIMIIIPSLTKYSLEFTRQSAYPLMKS